MTSEPMAQRTQKKTKHKGALIQEILDGRLVLRTDQAYRNTFGFVIHERPVGIFGIWSLGHRPKTLRILRAFNHSDTTLDPFTGLVVPCVGRQFGHIKPGVPVFLLEAGPNIGFGSRVVDAVAFTAERVEVNDADFKQGPKHLLFEVADLYDVRILG